MARGVLQLAGWIIFIILMSILRSRLRSSGVLGRRFWSGSNKRKEGWYGKMDLVFDLGMIMIFKKQNHPRRERTWDIAPMFV